MRLSPSVLLSLVVTCIACDDARPANGADGAPIGAAGSNAIAGGAAGSNVTPAGAGGAGNVAGAPSVDLTGVTSYELTFTEAHFVQPEGSQTPVAASRPNARLDVRAKADGSYEALVTADSGPPAPVAVTVDPTTGATQLTGAVWFLQDPYGEVGTPALTGGDMWQAFTLDAPPTAGTTFTATGRTTVAGDDTLVTHDSAGSGVIAADATPPAVTVGSASPLGGGVALPWDPVNVWLSEPLAPDAVAASISVAAPADTDDPTRRAVTIVAEPDAGSWTGSTRLQLVPSTWDAHGTETVAVGAGLLDPAGNASVPSSTTVAVLGVPPARSVVTFGLDGPLSSWGAAGIAGLPDQPDPRCEGGSCAILGPTRHLVGCPGQNAGIAARVTPGSKLSIRYRLAAEHAALDDMFGVTLVTHDGGTSTPSLAVPPLTDDGSGSATPFRSAWTTAEVDLPATTGSEIGVLIAINRAGRCQLLTQQDPNGNMEMELAVQSITVE